MTDGQTLLDVIEDPTVLDSFFNQESFIQEHGLENTSSIEHTSENIFDRNGLDSINFESHFDHIRGGGNPVQHILNPSSSVGSSINHQAFPHHLHTNQQNDLQTPHHPGLGSPIVGLSHDISRQRETCSHSDTDQTSLQQLLSTTASFTSPQQHHQTNILHSNSIHGQASQSILMQQQNHGRHQLSHRPNLQHLAHEHNNSETSSNIFLHSTSTTNKGVTTTVEQSICNPTITTQETTVINSAKPPSNVGGLPGFGKVQLLGGPNQVLPPNVFCSNAQLAGHVLPGTSLLQGNQVLPTSNILHGQVFQGGSILGAHILSSIGNISPQTQPVYVSSHSTSSNTTISSSSAGSNSSIGSLSMMLANSSSPAAAASFVLPSVASSHISKVSPQANSSPSSSLSAPSPQSVVLQKSPAPVQPIQSPTFVTQTSNVSIDGVVSGLVPNMTIGAQRTGTFNQSNVSNSSQVSSSIKQVVSGGQLIHLVGAAHSKQSIVHQAPKPIQPKPQILPKPISQNNLRPSTTPPAGKTLLGSKPIPPNNQQQFVIGGQQPTVITGQHALGGIVLNPSIFSPNTFLLNPQNGTAPMFIKLASPAGANNPTILTPLGSSPMVSMGKIAQPQTLVLPGSGQNQPIVIPQGITPTLAGGGLFNVPQSQRQQQPILRFVSNQAPLQIQQVQTPTGTTFVAIPTQQPSLNLSSVLPAAPGTLRTINPPVTPAPIQLAPINTATGANLGNIQIAGTSFHTNTSQAVFQQHTTQNIVNKSISTGLPILIRNQTSTPSSLPSSSLKSPPNEKSNKKKSTKKKKKENETKEITNSINLNDILKQSGIDNDMMFDENEFGGMAIDNPDMTNIVTTTSTQELTISSTSSLPTTYTLSNRTLQTTTPQPSVVNSIPGLAPNMCITVDHQGKLLLAPQEMVKTLGTLPTQQSANNPLPLQNMQLLNTGNIGSSLGETILLGSSNEGCKFTLGDPHNSGNIMRIKYPQMPNTSVLKLEDQLAKVKELEKIPSNIITEKTPNNLNISSLLNINGIEQAQVTGISNKTGLDLKNTSQTQKLSFVKMSSNSNEMKPHKTNSLEGSNSSLANSSKNTFEIPTTPVDKNTYQNKYIESVKRPLLIESISKSKKSNKKRKKSKSNEPVADISNDSIPIRTGQAITYCNKTDATCIRIEDGNKESLSSAGASMPSLSFMASPHSTGSNAIIGSNMPPINMTDNSGASKVSTSNMFSAPGSYKIPGHCIRSQTQPQPRIRHPGQTVHVMLSQQNQEAFKKVAAQMQVLNSKNSMTEQDKLLFSKLGNEYNRILSMAKPVPSPSITPTANTLAINEKNAVKYTHSIGHKKIILTPNQKKGYSPSVHLQAKDRYNDASRNDTFTSSQTIPHSSISTTFANVTTSVTTTMSCQTIPCYTRVQARDRNIESTDTTNSILSSQLNFSPITAAAPGELSPVRMVSSVVSHRTGESFVGRLSSSQTAGRSLTSIPNVNLVASQKSTTSPRLQLTMPLTKDQLFEHQLKTDQNGAVNPDYRTNFRNKTDGCKRMIRYHVYHDVNSSLRMQDTIENDALFENQSESIARKTKAMMYKFQSLIMKDSLQKNASSEQAMLLRLVNQEEKMISEREKLEVSRSGPGFIQNVKINQPIGSSYLDSYPWEEVWNQDQVFRKNLINGELEEVNDNSDDCTPDRPESEEPRLQIFEAEEQDRHTPESDESIARIAMKIGMNNFSSTDSDTQSPRGLDSNRVNNLRWNGMVPVAASSNGIEIGTSSSESTRISPRLEPDEELYIRKRKKRMKSKRRDRSKPKEESEITTEPCGGPLKLVLKKNEGDGTYSSASSRSIKKREKIRSKKKKLHLPLAHPDEPSTSNQPDIVYRPNNSNLYGPPNSNYTYHYS